MLHCHYLDLGAGASDWMFKFSTNQENTTQIWVVMQAYSKIVATLLFFYICVNSPLKPQFQLEMLLKFWRICDQGIKGQLT